jgi:hypothetical protein
MGIPKTFISLAILFEEAFKYGDDAKRWGYVGTSAEILCTILHFLQYCIF